MPYLQQSSSRIYYEYYEVVNAQPVCATLVNGYSRGLSDFKMLARRLNAVGISVLTFDQRGAGLTETKAPFSLKDLAQDVLSLWAHLNIKQSHLLGISMGGIVAQIAAGFASKSDIVQSLTLVSTLNKPNFYKQNTAWPSSLAEIEERLREYFAPEFIQKNSLLLKAMAKNTEKAIGEGLETKAKAQREALKDIHRYLPAPKVSVPTLIVHGKKDMIIAADAALALQEYYPNSQLILYEDCGHLILAERAQDFTESLLAFWQRS